MRRRLLIVSLLVTVASARAGDLQILFPLYAYPTWYAPATYIWDDIAAAAATVPITAVINPNNGPGGAGPNSDYVRGVSDLAAGGVTMIGYVSTNYGNRALSAIQADIDLWANSWTGIAGIFLDEESNDPATLSFYQGIRNYILTKPSLTKIVANPGTQVPQSFITTPIADTTVIYESGTGWDTYATDGYVANFPRTRFAMIAYNLATAAQMRSALDLAASRNFGYVFATDDSGANPYDTLPSYWASEVSHAASVPEPAAAALLGLGAFALMRRYRTADRRRKVSSANATSTATATAHHSQRMPAGFGLPPNSSATNWS
jgi:Spherulation-specific family 4/PEP-CTERM motif